MLLLRRLGDVLLWALALVGVLSGLVWGAGALGLVKPLIVVSGSMEPGIGLGALVIATPVSPADVDVGEVTSLPSPRSGVLVTHRVVAIVPRGDGVDITMRGDANGVDDPQPYHVADSDRVWQPLLVIPGVGNAVSTIERPTVAIPLGVAVLALLGLTFVPARGAPRHLAPKREAA